MQRTNDRRAVQRSYMKSVAHARLFLKKVSLIRRRMLIVDSEASLLECTSLMHLVICFPFRKNFHWFSELWISATRLKQDIRSDPKQTPCVDRLHRIKIQTSSVHNSTYAHTHTRRIGACECRSWISFYFEGDSRYLSRISRENRRNLGELVLRMHESSRRAAYYIKRK